MTAYAHDEDTYDLLHLVADPESPVGRDLPDLFLDACRADAAAHEGLVSVSRVREAMAPHVGEAHHRYSSLWSRFTGAGRPMVREGWEPCTGSASGNNGKPYPVRRWRGEQVAS